MGRINTNQIHWFRKKFLHPNETKNLYPKQNNSLPLCLRNSQPTLFILFHQKAKLLNSKQNFIIWNQLDHQRFLIVFSSFSKLHFWSNGRNHEATGDAALETDHLGPYPLPNRGKRDIHLVISSYRFKLWVRAQPNKLSI